MALPLSLTGRNTEHRHDKLNGRMPAIPDDCLLQVLFPQKVSDLR